MSVTDNIADYFTRIRNSVIANHEDVVVPHSELKVSIANLLLNEGFIDSYKVTGNKQTKAITIKLKYDESGKSLIEKIERISRSGKRVYVKKSEIPKVLNGFGVSIISTSKGVLSGRDARLANVGGEYIGRVY